MNFRSAVILIQKEYNRRNPGTRTFARRMFYNEDLQKQSILQDRTRRHMSLYRCGTYINCNPEIHTYVNNIHKADIIIINNPVIEN